VATTVTRRSEGLPQINFFCRSSYLVISVGTTTTLILRIGSTRGPLTMATIIMTTYVCGLFDSEFNINISTVKDC